MRIKKIIYQFYYKSNIIVDCTFWGYFLLMGIYRILIGDTPLLLSYLFFVLLGIFLGYKLARKAYDYLKQIKP